MNPDLARGTCEVVCLDRTLFLFFSFKTHRMGSDLVHVGAL